MRPGSIVRVIFEPIPDLEHRGYRLAPMDEIEAGVASGDAILIRADGRTIDIWWRAERSARSARWAPPPSATGDGVIAIEITERVDSDLDLGPVLEAALELLEQTPPAPPKPHP